MRTPADTGKTMSIGSVVHRIARGVRVRPIRLLLAEAQRLFRQSVRLLLEQQPDIGLVLEATDGHEAHHLVIEHAPDIALLDVDLPNCDIAALTTFIHQQIPDTRTLVLARYDEDTRIVSAMQAGAFGYILKDIDRRDFLRIIRATAHRKHVQAPAMLDHIVRTVPGSVQQLSQEQAPLPSNLTDREREILACAAKGRSNKEIADQLCVSIDTVKTHLHHIYQKLSVHGRVEAILTYLKAP